jgi:transcriptional regulator with XRE-family HTH domain
VVTFGNSYDLAMADARKFLSANLKSLREGRNFSQKELGRLTGVPWRSIQNAEAGLTDLGADSLVAIADVFLITVDDLLRKEASKPPIPWADVQRLFRLLSALDESQVPGILKQLTTMVPGGNASRDKLAGSE